MHVAGQVLTSAATASPRRAAASCSASCATGPRARRGPTVRPRPRPPSPNWPDHDLVVAADGVSSTIRTPADETFGRACWNRRLPLHLVRHRHGVRRLPFEIRATPHGVMQVHGYPYDAAARTLIVEMHRGGLAAGPASPRRPGHAGDMSPATRTRTPSSSARRSSATCSARPQPAPGNHCRWINFTTVRCAALVRRQRRAARRRRPHRALLHRLGHQARDGGRPRAGRLPGRVAGDPARDALAAYQPSAAGRRSRPSARPWRAWTGSRTSTSTSTSRRCGSRSTC